jgi:hypothetical protein
LGGGFTNYSTIGGTQYEIGLGYYFYQGNWWLMVGGDWIGYYPATIYAKGQLTKSAEKIDMGGEVAPPSTFPAMGSGRFASAGWQQAAYVRAIQYRDSTGTFRDVNPSSLKTSQTVPKCYTISKPTWGGTSWRYYFYFGGPGAWYSCS